MAHVVSHLITSHLPVHQRVPRGVHSCAPPSFSFPPFRPCPRSKARWGLHWALVAARSNPREYQLLSQQNVANGQKLQATVGISWMQLLDNVDCRLCFSNRLCFSDLFCIIIDWSALQHVLLFIPTVGSLWDMQRRGNETSRKDGFSLVPCSALQFSRLCFYDQDDDSQVVSQFHGLPVWEIWRTQYKMVLTRMYDVFLRSYWEWSNKSQKRCFFQMSRAPTCYK